MVERDVCRLGGLFALIVGLGIAGGGCSTFPHGAVASADGQPGAAAPLGPEAAVARAKPQTTPTPGAFTRVGGQDVLQPRSEFQWSIEVGQPPRTQFGTGLVGPDGTVLLGPYGAINVAGLTLEQARARIERHVSAYERNARVRLSPAGGTSAAQVQQVAQFQTDAAAAQVAPGPQNAPAQQGTTPPQAVKSTWRPIQRDVTTGPDLGTPATKASGNEFGTATGARPVRTASWQPQGWPLPNAGEVGPELAPAPKTIVGAPQDVGPFSPPSAGLPQGALGHAPPPPAHAPNEQHPVSLPRYRINPPDILQIDSLEGLLTQPVRGPHVVRPDGTIGVGAYGSVYVAGMTVDEAKVEIAKIVQARLDPSRKSLKDVLDGLSVDMLAYNSQVFYVITDRTGFGEIVQRFPITGNERVLDAISLIQGLPPEASKHRVWVARRAPGHGDRENILPVDWIGVSQKGQMATNYQLLPGDRLYIKAEAIQRFDYALSKFFSPIQRIFGITLLASQTVNSIKSGGLGGGR